MLSIIQIDPNRTILTGYDDNSFAVLVAGIENNLAPKKSDRASTRIQRKNPHRLQGSEAPTFLFEEPAARQRFFDKTRPFEATVLV